MYNRQFAHFEDRVIIIDDGECSDQILISLSEDRCRIDFLIMFPESDQETFVFDRDSVSCTEYLQAWFRKHDLYRYQKPTELYYPKMNTWVSKFTFNREKLDHFFGSDFLKNDTIDFGYIANLSYIQNQ